MNRYAFATLCHRVCVASAIAAVLVLLYGLIRDDARLIYHGLLWTGVGLIFARSIFSLLDSQFEVLNPILIFYACFFLFHVAQPIMQILIYGIQINTFDYFTAPLWTNLLGLCALELVLTFYRPRPADIPAQIHLDRGLVLLTPVLMFIVLSATRRFGGAELGYVLAACGVVVWHQFRSRAAFYYGLMIVAGGIGLSVGEFTRTFIAQVILLVLFYYNFFIRKLTVFWSFIIGLTLFPFMMFFAVYRSMDRIEALQKHDTNIIDVAKFAIEELKKGAADDKSLYFMTMQFDFPITYESYNNIVYFVPEYIDYLWGLTYYRVIFFVVPRSLWPDKPENITAEYVYQFVAANWHGHSMGTTLLGDFYWNAGYIGIGIGMFVVGLILQFLHKNMVPLTSNIFTFLLFTSFILLIPNLIRGATTFVLLYGIIMKAIPIMAMMFMLNAGPRLFRQSLAFGRAKVARVRGAFTA